MTKKEKVEVTNINDEEVAEKEITPKKRKSPNRKITEQQDKFDKLDKNLILGICETQNYSPKLEEISFLQVKPELQNGADKQKYRHVGAALLNSLVNLFHTKNIILDAIDGTIPFYVKNGFQKLCKEADFWNGASKMLIKNIK